MDQKIILFAGLVILGLIALMIASRNSEISERVAIQGKKAAMYPKVNKNLLFAKPQGIVFGRQGRRYVCKPTNVDGHIGIVGGSGSAKTSTIIMNTCLVNPDVPKFVVDIKGEINEKTAKAGDRRTMIINPDDRSTCGYR